MMMILPLRYTHIGRCFRVVAEYTLNPPTRGLNTSDHLSQLSSEFGTSGEAVRCALGS